MTGISRAALARMVKDNSVIIMRAHGPCPVFARGDRRTRATHWLSRDMLKQLEISGLLKPVPQGFVVCREAVKRNVL